MIFTHAPQPETVVCGVCNSPHELSEVEIVDTEGDDTIIYKCLRTGKIWRMVIHA